VSIHKNNDVDLPDSTDRIAEMITRAEKGDNDAMPVVRKLLDVAPKMVKSLGGDLVLTAENALINAMVGKNLAFREAVQRKMNSLRQELSSPQTTPLEQLLIDRIVTCWLHVHHADLMESHNVSMEVSEFRQKRQDRAHKRYLTAIKTLAQVRKMALPALQVNIGQNQVNMTGGTGQENE